MVDIPSLPLPGTFLGVFALGLTLANTLVGSTQVCDGVRLAAFPWQSRVVTLALLGRHTDSHLHSLSFHIWGHRHLKAICSTRNIKKYPSIGCQQVTLLFCSWDLHMSTQAHHLYARGITAGEQVLCFLDLS